MAYRVNIFGPCSLIEYLYPHLQQKIVRVTCHYFQGKDLAALSIDPVGPFSLVDFKLFQLQDYIEVLLQGNFPPELKVEVCNRQYAEPLGIEAHFQKPFRPVANLTIMPWHLHDPALPEQKTIYLNPGSAFGSGRHPSTRLSLSLLAKGIEGNLIAGRKSNLLDVGCGSGILGIAAIIFGANRVLGIETDPEAVKTAKQNVSLNGFTDTITIECGSLEILTENFDIIVANLVPSVGNKLLPEMVGYLGDCGLLVMAGFQEGLLPQVTVQLSDLGLTILEIRRDQGWSAIMAANG